MAGTTVPASPLAPYVPRLVRAWSEEPDAPRLRILDSSIVSIDISGFTALAERLQAKGKEGAEELVTRISSVFRELIGAAERHGGDVLKFRGDALLLLFLGDRHAERACGAASDMQWTIEAVGTQETTLGTVELRMSVGVHTADCHLFLTEAPHRELLVAGPAATRVFELEDLASAGEIVVSAETAAAIDPGWVGGPKEDAFLMVRLAPGASTIPPPAAVPGHHLAAYVPGPLRDHLAISSGEAEHRQVTVAFLKLSGTDSVLASAGPRALLARLDRLAAATGRACEAYGITWLESDIDLDAAKLYLTAGAPGTTGDDEEGMVRAIREIVAACPDLTLRAGVNRGHVFTGDIGAATRRTYAVMGDTVNLAARLCGKAEAGEILTVAPVLDRARTVYRTGIRPLRVKGKALEIEAHVVGEALGRREPDDRLTGRLVGRDTELAALLAVLDAARAGRRQLVEIVGPAGIGKSRLLAELGSRGDDTGFERVTTATDPYSAREPYAAFRTLLRKIAGIPDGASRQDAGAILASVVAADLPELVPWLPLLAVPFDAEAEPTPETRGLDPERSRIRIHQLVESFLDRLLTNPTLITVEDAHWLDDASDVLLRHLVSKPRSQQRLVVVTSLPGGTSYVSGEAGHATSIELRPLADGTVAELTAALAGEYDLPRHVVEALVARAGGNPLFVRELVAATARGDSVDSLPDTVESLLTTRIDTLDPTDRLLLRYASVLGMSFELAILPEILGSELEDAGNPARWFALDEFVVPTENGVLAFRHNLVRETSYGGLSFRRRREIHGRVGIVLESRAGSHADEIAALLSLHFSEGGDDGRAWHYSSVAGDHAAEGFANVVAAELYDRALAAAERSGIAEQQRAPVLEALGDVCERFGAYERARAAYGGAGAAFGKDETAATRMLAKEGLALERAGRYDEAAGLLERGIERVSVADLGDEGVRNHAFMERVLAGTRFRQARYEEAIEHADRAIALAETVGAAAMVARSSVIAGASYTELGRPDGVPYVERAIRTYDEIGDDQGLSLALNSLAIQRWTEGRWDEALELFGRSGEADARIGDTVGSAIHGSNKAMILSDQGRLEEASELFQELLRVSREAIYPLGEANGLQNLARVAARSGDFARAHELYDRSIEVFESIGAARYITETGILVAELLMLEGRHEEAIATASRFVEAARATPFGGLEAKAQRLIALSLLQAGRGEEAVPYFEESERIAREQEDEFELALTLKGMAEMGLGDADARRAQSSAILERLGVVSVPRVPSVTAETRSQPAPRG